MHVILLVLGLLTTVAGGAMVGFGIQYNEFGLGNTLIEAGTTAAVGGLILIGVAATVRQIKALTGALMASRPADTAAPVRERQQPTTRQIGRNGPLPDRPLPQRPPAPAPHRESPELASEISELKTLAEPPPQPAGLAPELPVHAAERPVPLRPEALAARPEKRSVEAIWRRDRSSAAVAPKVASEEAAVRLEAPPDIPSAHDLAPEAAAPVAIRPARAPQAVTILKSGVVEGMAYTLYSDGSIEAELPQGTLRFGSIGELRDYLSKQG